MAAVKQQTEVLASVRIPDGDLKGEIDGLVIRQVAPTGDWYILSKKESIEWALVRLLWCKVPSDGRVVWIEAVDNDRDGRADYVRTTPDSTRLNNLLSLPIWDRQRKMWLDTRGRPTAPPA
ncbi:MAG TPA: DUF3892 domain-containing protein [Gemmatimonadaceae bacterium]